MFILFDVSRHIRLYACVCVCGLACVRTSKRACVRLIERMHVCADLRECMSMGGGCHGPVHWGRAEWSMAAVAYSDLMCTRSNKGDAASHHSRITGTSLGELGGAV